MNQNQGSCINFIEWFRPLISHYTPKDYVFDNVLLFNEQISTKDGFADCRIVTGQILLGIYSLNDVPDAEPDFRRFVSINFVLDVVRDDEVSQWRPYSMSLQGFRNGYYVYDTVCNCWFQRELVPT